MEKLIVDEEGKIIIPAHVLTRHGLRPGDGLTVIEATEGLRLYQRGADSLTARWWDSLGDDEHRQAQAEALSYENMSEEEREHIWNETAKSVEEGMDGGEKNLPTK